MNLPIDVVVDLLMANIPNKWMWTLHGRTIEAKKGEDLSDAIREYLLPKPKLLSECEEGVEYLMVETPRRVCREFIYAVDVERQQRIARADQVQVIQPVEVK